MTIPYFWWLTLIVFITNNPAVAQDQEQPLQAQEITIVLNYAKGTATLAQADLEHFDATLDSFFQTKVQLYGKEAITKYRLSVEKLVVQTRCYKKGEARWERLKQQSLEARDWELETAKTISTPNPTLIINKNLRARQLQLQLTLAIKPNRSMIQRKPNINNSVPFNNQAK